MRAAIYARISLDREGEGQGVERQLEDCRKLIAERGWTLVAEYVDNDVSAFSGKRRPQFEAMLKGDFDTLVVWRTDRLARRGKDLQRFLDLARPLTSCTEPEFTGSTGLLMLRILAGFAEHESGVKSERVARKMQQRRANGEPHAGGKRTFGYSTDKRRIVESEAAELRKAASRLLAGERVNDVLLDWLERGITTVGGKSWTSGNLKRLLLSPVLRGLTPDGNPGNWPAILTPEVGERLKAVLTFKRQKTPRRFLLTGLLRCGKCSALLVGGGEHYRCLSKVKGGCGGIAIKSEALDDHVTRMALAAIPSQPEQRREDEVEHLLEALRQVEAQVAQLSKDHYVSQRIGRAAYLASNDELEHRAALLREQVADHEGPQNLGSLDEIVEQWEHQSLSFRQAVLRQVLDYVEVRPAANTRSPVEGRLKFFWRA